MGFLVQCSADEKFFSGLIKERDWKIDLFTMVHKDVHHASVSSSALRAAFAEFQVEGYLADFVTCPDVVMAFLCNFGYLHVTPFARFNSAQLPDAFLSRIASTLMARTAEGGGGGGSLRLYNCEVGSERRVQISEYFLKRSRYAGPSAPPSISSSQVMASLGVLKVATAGSSSHGERDADFDQQRDRLCASIEETGGALKAAAEELRRARELQGQVQARVGANKQERADLLKAERESAELRRKMEQQRLKMEALARRVGSDSAAERQQKQREYAQVMERLLDLLDAALALSTRCAEVFKARVAAQDALGDVMEQLREAHRVHQEARGAVAVREEAVKACRKACERVRRLLDEVEAELEALERDAGGKDALVALVKAGRALPEKTLLEIEARMEAVEHRIKGTVDNQRALERFEEVRAAVETLEREVAAEEAALLDRERDLEERAQKWHRDVVAIAHKMNIKFGEYMSELNFGGEVELRKVGTIGTYELQMKVSFREQSGLSDLSGNVQSGGERAVATVMYLMALQDIVSSPFRVVDEINQGMDATNERLVFDRIVKNCCDAERPKPQYFLVTPKLLQGLRAMDNPHVTVLLVFNGAGIPKLWDMTTAISQLRKRRLREGESEGEVGGEGERDREVGGEKERRLC
jgi:hypothetical protein